MKNVIEGKKEECFLRNWFCGIESAMLTLVSLDDLFAGSFDQAIFAPLVPEWLIGLGGMTDRTYQHYRHLRMSDTVL